MKQPKYTYFKVLQSNHGYGWDDVEFFDLKDSDIKERKQALKEYRENQPNASHRFIERRELNKGN